MAKNKPGSTKPVKSEKEEKKDKGHPSSPKPTGAAEVGKVDFSSLRTEFRLGDDALTVKDAINLLGWEPIPESDESTPMLTDLEGNKIRCTRNGKNRPFDENWAKQLSWDILNRNWADSRNSPEGTEGVGTVTCTGLTVNGESIILGRTKEVLSGQHRLAALILAGQRYRKEPERWGQLWQEEPSIECLLVYGVDESARTTRTLDNTKKRTLADVLFSDPTFFGVGKDADDPNQRKLMLRMVDSCIRILWQRTNAKAQPFSPAATHSELLEFLDRHPGIKDSVKYIYSLAKKQKEVEQERAKKAKKSKEPNEPNVITKSVSPGYAAGLLYLMGASGSDTDTYHSVNNVPRREVGEDGTEYVNWDAWEGAKDYWRCLYTEDHRVSGVRLAVSGMHDVKEDYADRELDRIFSCIVMGWNVFREYSEATDIDSCRPNFHIDDNGRYAMDGDPDVNSSVPVVGGIDVGKPKKETKDDEDGATANPIVEDDVDNQEELSESEDIEGRYTDDSPDSPESSNTSASEDAGEEGYMPVEGRDNVPHPREVESKKERIREERVKEEEEGESVKDEEEGEENTLSLHDEIQQDLRRREEAKAHKAKEGKPKSGK